MAPKAPSKSPHPSKEKEQRQEPFSEEEESSSTDEEEKEQREEPSSEEEESLSTDEEEDQEEVTKKVKNNKPSARVTKAEPKSVVQENGSDSDSDLEATTSDYKMQPIAKPSMASAKRKHGEIDGSHLLTSRKKSRIEEKKSSSAPGGGVGAGCINRLWSNEDEIAVLNGMIDFRNVKGLDPCAFMGDFYGFVKGKLKVDFSRVQLRTKITRLKKKFLNALKKGENGLRPSSSKPHEDMAFELSKKIWGAAVGNTQGSKNGAGKAIKENGAGKAIKENAKKDIVKAEKIGMDGKEIVKTEKDGEAEDFWSKYPFFGASFHNMVGNFPSLAMSDAGMSFVKESLSSIGNVKAKELDEKWRKLIVEETELNYKMLTLMTEQVKMVLDQ